MQKLLKSQKKCGTRTEFPDQEPVEPKCARLDPSLYSTAGNTSHSLEEVPTAMILDSIPSQPARPPDQQVLDRIPQPQVRPPTHFHWFHLLRK
jgi:hypothetical protein